MLSPAAVQRGWVAAEQLGTGLGGIILVLYMTIAEDTKYLTRGPDWHGLHVVELTACDLSAMHTFPDHL